MGYRRGSSYERKEFGGGGTVRSLGGSEEAKKKVMAMVLVLVFVYKYIELPHNHFLFFRFIVLLT